MTLTFTPEQIAIIDRALSARPYGEVAALIADINKQIAIAQATVVELADEPV